MQDRLTESPSSGRAGLIVTIAVVLLVIAGAAAALVVYAPAPSGTGVLVRELRDRGRIAVVGGEDLGRLEAEGAQLVPASDVRGLSAALASSDEERLESILRRDGIAGLLVDGRRPAPVRPAAGAPIAERLRAYDRFEVLQGAYLSPVAALYLRRRPTPITPAEGAILARAARQILRGSTLPRVRAFPESLRRTRNVEVVVLLRQNGRPRLWRSARGGSIARALLTACTVARERWTDRQTAMGGPIERRLPSLAVEIYLLEEDGTIGDRSAPFIERMITPSHGVAFEDRESWHYYLPELTRDRGRGSAVRAYRALFDEAGLPRDSLEQRRLRLYRVVATRVGVSAPTISATPSGASRETPSDGALEGLDEIELEGLDAL